MRLSTIVALAALVAMFIWAQRVNQRPDPFRPDLAGKAQAVDGDSLVVNNQAIRLQGIDAPEYAQTCRLNGAEYPCGKEAAQALRKLISRGEVTCKGLDYDRYNRLLGVCHVRGENVAAIMVREGYALSYGDYLIEEARARNEKKGLWRGEFESPRDWRQAHPRLSAPQPNASSVQPSR